MRWIVTVIVFSCWLWACSYPTTVTEVPDERPTLAILNALPGDILYIDGLRIGYALEYDGLDQSLLVEPGPHRIQIKNGEEVIYTDKLFLAPNQSKKLLLPRR